MSDDPQTLPSLFSLLSDDLVLNIFSNLQSTPTDWARLSCASSRFASLIRAVCYPSHCLRLLLPSDVPDVDAASLHKLSLCCPGLRLAGVLLENSDFGLERAIGPDQSYPWLAGSAPSSASDEPSPSAIAIVSSQSWSLFDDLYFDTVYDPSESQLVAPTDQHHLITRGQEYVSVNDKRRKWIGPLNSHPASGSWNLSREQGNKLLASRFRGDVLYICDWPGCVHAEEKRKYMLFRGVFKNFKKSRVWRTINDGNRVKSGLNCAYCACKETWDLHSAFCLRRVFGFHDDGEPVVRAYVCENGHVSGAWTERPMYA